MNERKQQELLAEWYRRIVLSSQGHYNTAQRLRRLNWFLGIPVVCLTAVVGTSVFATLEKEVAGEYRIVLGLVSIIAAVLASLQTFLGFAERAEKHRIFGAHYAALRRELEVLFTRGVMDSAAFQKAIEDLAKRMDTLGEQAPHIPSKLWLKTEERYRDRFKVRFPFPEADAITGEHPSTQSKK
jgi:hypothetical protein